MDPYDSPLRSPVVCPKNPFLHSLLRTSQPVPYSGSDHNESQQPSLGAPFTILKADTVDDIHPALPIIRDIP